MSGSKAVVREGSVGETSSEVEEIALTAVDIPGAESSSRSHWTSTLLLRCGGGCSVGG